MKKQFIYALCACAQLLTLSSCETFPENPDPSWYPYSTCTVKMVYPSNVQIFNNYRIEFNGSEKEPSFIFTDEELKGNLKLYYKYPVVEGQEPQADKLVLDTMLVYSHGNVTIPIVRWSYKADDKVEVLDETKTRSVYLGNFLETGYNPGEVSQYELQYNGSPMKVCTDNGISSYFTNWVQTQDLPAELPLHAEITDDEWNPVDKVVATFTLPESLESGDVYAITESADKVYNFVEYKIPDEAENDMAWSCRLVYTYDRQDEKMNDDGTPVHDFTGMENILKRPQLGIKVFARLYEPSTGKVVPGMEKLLYDTFILECGKFSESVLLLDYNLLTKENKELNLDFQADFFDAETGEPLVDKDGVQYGISLTSCYWNDVKDMPVAPYAKSSAMQIKWHGNYLTVDQYGPFRINW